MSQKKVSLRFWLIILGKHLILLLHPNGLFSVYIRDHFEYWTIHGGCIEPEIFLSKVGATRYHIMENTLKVDDFQKSVLICKYLRNKSSDLYEILNLSFYVSNELLQKFCWRSMNPHTRMRHKCAHACFITCARVYVLCARVRAQIFTQIFVCVHY